MSDHSGAVLGRPATPPSWVQDQDFDAFVQARGAVLLRLARGMLRDPQHAEDVVQDVLVNVHRHWAKIVAQDVPDAYVRRMLVNACTSFWRRAARRELAAPDLRVTQLVDGRGGVPDAAGPLADRAQVVALLRRLPARQRAAIVLRHYEGMADAEVADVMGTSVQTVRSNVHRGLASLRRMLDETQEVAR